MKKALWTILMLGASSAVKGMQFNPVEHMELTRLKMSLKYVQVIKTFRLLSMSFFSLGVCLVFLFIGLLVFHISLFLYAPWSMETKLIVGLLCSVAYMLAALFMISRVFSSDKWLKIFQADTILDHIHKEALQKENIEPNVQR